MRQVFIILKKEFISRVKKKSFIVSTLLLPFIMPAFLLLIGYLNSKEKKDSQPKQVLVLDKSEHFVFTNSEGYNFEKTYEEFGAAKAHFAASDYFAFLYIPQEGAESKTGVTLFSKTNLSLVESSAIKAIIEGQVREGKIKQYQIDSAVLALLQPNVKLNEIKLTEKGDEKLSSSTLSFGIGYALSMLIYMFVLIYGSQVMQSVIEEKASKVIEIIVSIVKPIQLMMGKVFGIASVGLFQFILWVLLFVVFSMAFMSYLPQIMDAQNLGQEQSLQQVDVSGMANSTDWMQVLFEVPYMKIMLLFLFYFLFGFLLYGAMFATVGSAVDTPQEAQQFVLPITIPMLISIIGSMGFILQNPTGAVSFWLSIIPFTSPISMMTRIAFDVSWWELLLSMVLLVLTTFFMLWAAGRVFKVGILSQGAKVGYKTLLKWFLKG
ncbi:MAG: ABC transporter permease [Bacteroidia bacterium]|nr:ABC transporter permease [Bacteroidia bacterium]